MTARAGITLAFEGAGDPVPVQGLHLDRGLAHPVGRAVLVLPRGVAPPQPGGEVTLGLVHSGRRVDVMTGHAAHLETGPTGTRVSVFEHSARLMVRSADASFGATTAGQIITDLCAAADVPTGTVLPGASLPHMVLRADRTRLDHAQRLAALSGLMLTTDTGGRLGTTALTIPVPAAPPDLERAAVHRAAHSAQITIPQTRMIGAGAMGSAGPGAATLPLADVGLISAGPAQAGDVQRCAAIRTLADATLAQLARAQRQAARRGGLRVSTPLAEDLSPGDVVLLPDARGLPLRLARLEDLTLGFSAQTGLTAHYRFSDLEVA